MLVSFHLVVSSVIAGGLNLSALNWAVAPIYRSHCKVKSLAELLGGVLTSGSSDTASLLQMLCGYFHVVTHGLGRCGLRCCVSPALHTLGSGSPLEPESLHWLQRSLCTRWGTAAFLCIKASGNKEWVLFPLLSSRSCQTALKLLPWGSV